MLSEKSFKLAFVVSLAAHTALFFQLPQMNFLSLQRRAPKKTQVTYIKEEARPQLTKSYNQKIPRQKSPRFSFNKNFAPPPFAEKQQIFEGTKNIPIKKPESLKPRITAVKKKITLPSLSSEKITNPVYLSYYQIIRERIRRAAYQNYTRVLNGEIHLSFIILNNGRLKDVKINQEKSCAYSFLNETAINSIYDASPFPKFPEELAYPQLSFNVIISFEIE